MESRSSKSWLVWVPLLAIAAGLLGSSCSPTQYVQQKTPWTIWKLGRWLVYREIADEFKPPVILKPKTARCLIFGFDECPACVVLHRTIRRELVTKGWRVGPLPTDDLEDIDVKGPDPRVRTYAQGGGWSCPTLVIVDQSGKELARRPGPMKGDDLIAWLQSHQK